MRSRFAFIVCVACVAFAAGCGSEKTTPLVPVRVRITLDGQPLSRGSVSLRPVSPSAWDQPTGSIGDDGQSELFTNGRAGAPPGEYRVVVFATEATQAAGGAHPGLPKSLVPARYNDPANTPLRLTVIEATSEPRPLELSSRDE